MSVDALTVRVDDHGRRISRLENDLDQNTPKVLASEIHNLREDIREARAEVRGLRRTVITFAFTVAVAAIGLALTVVFAGHP